MDMNIFVQSLSDTERMQLLIILTPIEKIPIKKTLFSDWYFENHTYMTIRLRNVLSCHFLELEKYPDIQDDFPLYIDDIRKKDLFRLRNFGTNCYKELKLLCNNQFRLI